MAADTRFKLTPPLRSALATALYPVQWLAQQPLALADHVGDFFTTVTTAQSNERAVRSKLTIQSLRSVQVEQLQLENARLRKLLDLRQALTASAQVAEVLYDAADIYSRKVIIDKGVTQNVELGSAVMDERGVLGQVTRVYPLVAEVTLLIDREQAIPVLNVRTGARSVAYGDPGVGSGAIELRFMGANADVVAGDLLTTSGVDGVYPAGLPVARVAKVERRADTAFAHIVCTPVGGMGSTRHVMVIKPVSAQIAARPPVEPEVVLPKRTASHARTTDKDGAP